MKKYITEKVKVSPPDEPEYTINITWSTSDVEMRHKEISPDTKLTFKDYCTILDRIKNNHDCEYGITWYTISDAIENYINEL